MDRYSTNSIRGLERYKKQIQENSSRQFKHIFPVCNNVPKETIKSAAAALKLDQVMQNKEVICPLHHSFTTHIQLYVYRRTSQHHTVPLSIFKLYIGTVFTF